MIKIVLLTYTTKFGREVTGRFLKTDKGYIPIIIDKESFLDKSNKVMKEEELTELNFGGKRELFF